MRRFVLSVVSFSLLAFQLWGQTEKVNVEKGDPAAVFIEALNERTALVAAISSEAKSAATALVELKASVAKTSQSATRDLEFSFAAVDVGQRLVAEKKGKEAVVFLKEAESSLDLVLRNTSERQPREKAMVLQQLAMIRAGYLGKYAQARTDLEQAIKLQPEDASLVRKLNALPRDPALAAPLQPKS